MCPKNNFYILLIFGLTKPNPILWVDKVKDNDIIITPPRFTMSVMQFKFLSLGEMLRWKNTKLLDFDEYELNPYNRKFNNFQGSSING